MPYANLKDIRVFYTDDGAGDVIVFLHGFTLDHRMWEYQVPFFSETFRVICPDTRGHGKSDAPKTGYYRDERVEDVLQLLDKLKIDRCHLVGLSHGGVTAIGFALKYPERLHSLALVSTSAGGFNVGARITQIDRIAREKSVEEARKRWINLSLRWFAEDKVHVRDLIVTMMREHSGAYWSDPMRGKYPRIADLDNVHQITTPTHIFVGALDRIFVPLAHPLHERIQGCGLTIYEKVGHLVNLEIPDRFNQDLLAFISDIR